MIRLNNLCKESEMTKHMWQSVMVNLGPNFWKTHARNRRERSGQTNNSSPQKRAVRHSLESDWCIQLKHFGQNSKLK